MCGMEAKMKRKIRTGRNYKGGGNVLEMSVASGNRKWNALSEGKLINKMGKWVEIHRPTMMEFGEGAITKKD